MSGPRRQLSGIDARRTQGDPIHRTARLHADLDAHVDGPPAGTCRGEGERRAGVGREAAHRVSPPDLRDLNRHRVEVHAPPRLPIRATGEHRRDQEASRDPGIPSSHHRDNPSDVAEARARAHCA